MGGCLCSAYGGLTANGLGLGKGNLFRRLHPPLADFTGGYAYADRPLIADGLGCTSFDSVAFCVGSVDHGCKHLSYISFLPFPEFSIRISGRFAIRRSIA